MNDKYIAQATTQEEAIIKGLNALGISRDEAEITIEEPGKKGFLGIGQKDAVVIVERKEKVNLFDEMLNNEFDMRRDQTATTVDTQEKEVEDAEDLLEEEDIKEAPTEKLNMNTEELTEEHNPAEVEIVEEQKETTQVESHEFSGEEIKAETEEEVFKNDQEAIEDVRQYLKDIILQMNISDVEVYTSRVKSNVKYDIRTENAGLVIGRHGKVLNGLQTLAQNHMHQLAHSKINVHVDAEQYRERRKSIVETLADRTADKVIKTNRRVKLDPMPAHERKQIHRYLNMNPKVKTHSEGRDPKRYLVVEPAED